MPQTEAIQTTRLVLTPLAVSDAAEMAQVLSEPDLYRYTGGDPPTTGELEERYTFQEAGSPRDGETWHNWIVRLDDVAIGYVQATVIGEGADLAWVIGRPWQGNGYAYEAAARMLDWLRERGVGRFTAHIHPDHAASNAVASRIGLEPTGESDQDGEMIWSHHVPRSP